METAYNVHFWIKKGLTRNGIATAWLYTALLINALLINNPKPLGLRASIISNHTMDI